MRELQCVGLGLPFFLGTALLVSLAAAAESKPKTLTYKVVGDIQIQADVYQPDTSPGPRPVIVWLHGGALVMGHRQDIPKQLIELSQNKSLLLVSLDYRLAPQAKLPQIIEDLKDGLTWIRTQGPELFGADPGKMVVAGASAGGYLAMMSGIVVDPPPTALVSYYGFGDIDGKWTTEPNKNFLGGDLIDEQDAWSAVGDKILTNTDKESRQDRWRFFAYLKQTGRWTRVLSELDPATERDKLAPFCPIRNLSPKYPPILLLHGTADRDVPYEQSVKMARALERIGRPHELITLVDGRHGLWGGDPAKVLQAVDRSMQYIVEHLDTP